MSENSLPARLPRRRLLALGGAALAAGGAVFAARWFNIGASLDAGHLSVQQAHARATAGEILLIDIRGPDEWAQTGIGEGAVPLDMRRDDFTQALQRLADERPGLPIALICARGVRSRALARRLDAAGFTQIVDVPEGMFGSGAGPGWLRAGLPVVAQG